jgi:hypothetical protein
LPSSPGALSSRSIRASSTCWICSRTKQARQVAPQLGQRVRRQANALRRAQRLQALGCAAQGRLEAAHAQASEGGLDPVDHARALGHQALVLAGWALGILLRERGHRGHAAMATLAAEPAEEGALEQLGIQPVRLGPPVLTRDGDARRVDHVRLDPANAQPAGEPEPVAASLVGNRDALDSTTSLGRFAAPALEQAQQRCRVRLQLLERLPLDAGDDPSHKPARLAHVDDRDQSAVLLQGNKGPAQAVRLRHGGAPLVVRDGGECVASCRSPHSFCTLALMRTVMRSSPRN